MDKIREMLKADKFTEVATVCIGDDMPLTLKLVMDSGEGELSFLLAPRLEADD